MKSRIATAGLPRRQVHLDFHNSPFIPDVAVHFDAAHFARTMKQAHVESVTVFARCIHGMSYYPTRFGRQHPNMKGRDLLGEQIEALHREGLRAPIYITITWEEGVAAEHPEWRQFWRDGRMATMNTMMSDTPMPGSQWKVLDFIHPDYMDYIEAYLEEIMAAYPVDGFFIDMVFYVDDASWGPGARALRHQHGLTGADHASHLRLESLAQRAFCERFTRQIQARHPQATVFYNTPNNFYLRRNLGASARWPFQSHVEVESLPSGIWGYSHFPKIGRRLLAQDKPWLGMTGRFQKMWGDFGGIKPQPALEYECFRTQALGGANSIGDQLLPNGTLDPDAYQLIGSVFRQCAAAEPFFANSEPLRDVGILSPRNIDDTGTDGEWSEEGAVLLMNELRYECAVLDDDADWSPYRTLLLPDDVHLDDGLVDRLLEFHRNNGCLLLSHRSLDHPKLMEALGLRIVGDTEFHPNYWRPAPGSGFTSLCAGERVLYSRGLNVEAVSADVVVLVERVEPFFQRNDQHYSSHFQTPSSGRASPYAAVLAGERWACFTDPVFREYRQAGNLFIRQVLRPVLKRLQEGPRVRGLSHTIEAVCRRRGNDLLIHLLHYIPHRKAVDCEVIEAGLSFAGECLTLDRPVHRIRRFPDGQPLQPDANGGFPLPADKGRLLLVAQGYFNERPSL